MRNAILKPLKDYLPMDDLAPVIEHIAQIASKAEGSKWELAEAIHSAFSELPAYEHGLLSGLCEKLRYTSATIYNYRNSWTLKSSFNGHAPDLHVSHYARMFNLITRYNLQADDVIGFLEMAQKYDYSVDKMAQDVERNHEPDPQGKYEKSIKRFTSLGRNILNDPLNRMDKPLYANLYDVIKELENVL